MVFVISWTLQDCGLYLEFGLHLSSTLPRDIPVRQQLLFIMKPDSDPRGVIEQLAIKPKII